MGFADWDAKWGARVRGTSFGLGMRPARQAQFEAYTDAARQGPDELRELFRALQMIPQREAAILRRLGLLETIALDPASFDED